MGQRQRSLPTAGAESPLSGALTEMPKVSSGPPNCAVANMVTGNLDEDNNQSKSAEEQTRGMRPRQRTWSFAEPPSVRLPVVTPSANPSTTNSAMVPSEDPTVTTNAVTIGLSLCQATLTYTLATIFQHTKFLTHTKQRQTNPRARPTPRRCWRRQRRVPGWSRIAAQR